MITIADVAILVCTVHSHMFFYFVYLVDYIDARQLDTLINTESLRTKGSLLELEPT